MDGPGMRYTRKNANEKPTRDWVEFRSGFAKLPMAKAIATWSLPETVAPWIEKCQFFSIETGEEVHVIDGQSIMDHLNFVQWDWLSDQLRAWARDDAIDPEA